MWKNEKKPRSLLRNGGRDRGRGNQHIYSRRKHCLSPRWERGRLVRDFWKEAVSWGGPECVVGEGLGAELRCPRETALGSSLPTATPTPTRERPPGPAERGETEETSACPRESIVTNAAWKESSPKPRAFPDGLLTCLLIPTGKLEPLVALLMGATMATRVGDGADCLFFGGNAGGGLE